MLCRCRGAIYQSVRRLLWNDRAPTGSRKDGALHHYRDLAALSPFRLTTANPEMSLALCSWCAPWPTERVFGISLLVVPLHFALSVGFREILLVRSRKQIDHQIL